MWFYTYLCFVLTQSFKFYIPINKRKKCKIPTESYIFTRMKLGSSLSRQYIASFNKLSTKSFYSKPSAFTIPTVSRTPSTFFMSHLPHLLTINLCYSDRSINPTMPFLPSVSLLRVGNHQDLTEFHCISRISLDFFNFDNVTRLYYILLTTGFYNCLHCHSS